MATPTILYTTCVTKEMEKEESYETHNEWNICSRGDNLTMTLTFLDRIEERAILAEH